MIKAKQNGDDVGEMQAQLTKLLDEYAKTNDPDIEKELIKLYEKMSKFKKGCGVCIAGRSMFIKSLRQIQAGEKDAAISSMKASMKSVKIKWNILKNKFVG